MSKIKKECWNLDFNLVKWINKHLKVYKNDASRHIDLTFHKFVYNYEEYTFEELIDMLIYITDNLLEKYEYFEATKELNQLKNQMYDILKIIHWQLWW